MARAKTRRSQGFSVFPRKDGRWGWAVTTGYDEITGNATRVQGTARSQKEASEKAVAVTAKVTTGAHVPMGRDRTVADWLDEWLETYIKPHREPKTVSYYSGMIEHHLRQTVGSWPLRKLTAESVQKLLNKKSKPETIKKDDGTEVTRTLSPETVRGIRATLRSALTQAYRNGLVAENVAQRVASPRTSRKTPEYLSADQVKKLLEKCQGEPLEGLIRLTLYTGLRIGEATGLTWQSVDFEGNCLRVTSQLQRIEGKLVLKSLKSERATRTLHLTDTALDVLKAEKAKQVMIGKPERNPIGLCFLNNEHRPCDPKYVDKHLKALLVKAGLPSMSFHKLRHTAASLALSAGVPLATVRDQLGHSQIALTANTYAHAVPTALKEAAESLERLFGSA